MFIISYISAFNNSEKVYKIVSKSEISFYERTHGIICVEHQGGSILDCIKIINSLTQF